MHEGVLTRIRPVPHSRFRLFLLHHAGGSPQGYRAWVRHFPADWDVCLVEAPGRGRSSDSAPFTDARDLARHLCDRLQPYLDRPYGLFGHSMGALVGYEMALRLAEGPAPSWLGVSAWSPAPGVEWDRPRHRLTDERLRASVARMGGTPASVLDDHDRWRDAEPLVRADLAVVDTWRPEPGTPLLRHPVTVLGGEDDRGMPPSRLAAWHGRTEGPVRTHILPGGHFYFVGRLREVAARVTEDVRAAEPVSV
ncbi:thioesterase II family protein [Nocardiopsis sp. NRRL B-16309]|uniref:thioesterase II family protein n=1 Tax=Nocardiopsis sp. NRRL B-16309 TaxID=1519494 RepID=UPI0006AECC3D|nr:thioesterase domain-containing protein [Nocardiopsis sp. NRRL B-16309]